MKSAFVLIFMLTATAGAESLIGYVHGLHNQIAELKAPRNMTCIIKQYNETHEYPNCTVLNQQYARAY